MQARILEAAGKRFKHYGYAKTSVAEVAADLTMSPGNLYRYFPGKIDIAMAIADAMQTDHHAALVEATKDDTRSAAARLRALFHLDLTLTFRMIADDPRGFELVEIIRTERRAWVAAWSGRERALIAAILTDGMDRSEFRPGDASFTAEMMQVALVKFRHPRLWAEKDLPSLERELGGILGLILDGLAGIGRQAQAA